MANHRGIHSFSQSLTEFLEQSYAAFRGEPGNGSLPSINFEALGTADFNSDKEIKDKLTIYLHRIVPNQQLRNVRAAQPVGTIGLDLHYLLTIWLEDARDEQVVMGWAIRELHYHSFLDRSSLSLDADWALDDTISIMPLEMGTEEMSRLWEMSRRGYRLSFPFVARIVRLSRATPDETTPVVAARFAHADLEETEP